MSVPRLALALLATMPIAASCRRAPPPRDAARPDWDRAAFVLQLVRHEYREQTEHGDVRGVPALAAAVDGARGVAAGNDPRARWLDGALVSVREALLRHDPPRAIARLCTSLSGQLAVKGIPLAAPAGRPDIERGASLYQVACAPCHGPPRGPPPPAAAGMVPPAPRPMESAQTPYELYNRITYGGVGTAMPSFAETLPEAGRWDVAFYLFAERWPPCTSMQGPPLAAAAVAHMSDYDIWKARGYGAAACLRRNFR